MFEEKDENYLKTKQKKTQLTISVVVYEFKFQQT